MHVAGGYSAMVGGVTEERGIEYLGTTFHDNGTRLSRSRRRLLPGECGELGLRTV
jgi:hypothetical protein